MLAGASVEEIVHVLKFIILSVVKLDGAYEFDEFKFFKVSGFSCLFNNCHILVKFLGGGGGRGGGL